MELFYNTGNLCDIGEALKQGDTFFKNAELNIKKIACPKDFKFATELKNCSNRIAGLYSSVFSLGLTALSQAYVFAVKEGDNAAIARLIKRTYSSCFIYSKAKGKSI